MSSPALDTTSHDASWSSQAGRLMRTHPRQTWLVPLLAVPLSHVALSASCTPEVLDRCVPTRDHAAMRRDAAIIAATAAAVAASNGTRGLTDDEAWLFLQFSHDYVGIGQAILLPPSFLMVGMHAAPFLPMGPLLRLVAEWIDSAALPVPLAAFISAGVLPMTKHRPMFLPKIDSRYAQVTRAIDRRLGEEGVETWDDALALAHRFWSGAGWRDLGVWEQYALDLVVNQDVYKTEQARQREEHETQRRRHRAERKRLQETAAQAHDELRRLRPLRVKVDGLRDETERLRNREAELVQGRDRAVARTKALEAANAKLERECREANRRLAALMPAPEPEPQVPVDSPLAEEPELPATLLAGRTVFFFTGELRKSSAEATAESLRALGADDIRTFCLRQGSHGPEAYPPDALIVVDFRFAGHSQSGLIEERAGRSGAQFLGLRSGKGGLARTVASALLSARH
jgi:hypothetical protein